jgi:hypothetical protein
MVSFPFPFKLLKGMSMCVLGMSEEFKQYNIGVNALWPLTSVSTGLNF